MCTCIYINLCYIDRVEFVCCGYPLESVPIKEMSVILIFSSILKGKGGGGGWGWGRVVGEEFHCYSSMLQGFVHVHVHVQCTYMYVYAHSHE